MRAKRNAPEAAELETAAACGGNDGYGADVEKYRANLRREREWRRLNPRLWDEVEAWALNEAAHGRRFAMQTALERIRWKDYADDEGNPTKVSNDFGAIWSRLLIARHPEIRPFVTMRPSVYDRMEVF